MRQVITTIERVINKCNHYIIHYEHDQREQDASQWPSDHDFDSELTFESMGSLILQGLPTSLLKTCKM